MKRIILLFTSAFIVRGIASYAMALREGRKDCEYHYRNNTSKA